MDRVRGFFDGAVALQIVDDDADGLRRLQRHPREISARQAGIGAQHGQHHELRRGDAEFGQRPLHRQPGRGLGLPQQIGEVALLAAFAFSGRRRADHGERGIFGGFFPAPGGFPAGTVFSAADFPDFFDFFAGIFRAARDFAVPKLPILRAISVLL
jgi:hypothetical protein